MAAVREATPDGFLVGVRISPEVPEQGVDLDESLIVAGWLASDGVDFVHVSNWDSFKAPAKYPSSKKPLTTWFREAIGPLTPMIATGAVWTPSEADLVLEQGADLVGLGPRRHRERPLAAGGRRGRLGAGPAPLLPGAPASGGPQRDHGGLHAALARLRHGRALTTGARSALEPVSELDGGPLARASAGRVGSLPWQELDPVRPRRLRSSPS